MSIRLAVLITCYNRRHTTESCLKALTMQSLPPTVAVQVYLHDAGSSDGTAEAIRTLYPSVTVIDGNPAEFWNKGMRRAFAAALSDRHDFYVWLNDDTMLDRSALATLLSTHRVVEEEGGGPAIIVGSTRDIHTGMLTYGGVVRSGGLNLTRMGLVEPDMHRPRRCDSMNGNCVLIPDGVAQVVGNLEGVYTHGMGDFDYGLRAKARGIPTFVAPGWAGSCSRNPVAGSWRDTSLPWSVRYQKLISPKGLPPKEWKHFCRRHAGPLWQLVYASPYLKLMVRRVVAGGSRRVTE